MQIIEKVLERVKTESLVSFLSLGLIATALPFFIHLQWLTGPVVNAILILVLFLSGIRAAMLVALIPSLMALSGGLIPAILAPMIPFIMIGNVIFILAIDYFYNNSANEKKGYWTGIVFGALLKFAFLYLSLGIIGKLLIKQELVLKVAQILSWPQFVTAVLGGAIAFGFLKWLKRI